VCTSLALGLGMVELIATILVVALLLYVAWPWLWHIAITLALAFVVYLALPWFWQSESWEDFKAWLQQIHVPQLHARSYPSRSLGQEEYPRPNPRPILVHVDRRRGVDVFCGRGSVGFCGTTKNRIDLCPPDIHIFTSTKQPWVTLPPGAKAVPELYDINEVWPAESLDRRRLVQRGDLLCPRKQISSDRSVRSGS
jgi:hypothetical protein